MSAEETRSGLRIARGAVLQVHPRDREKRVSFPARQAAEIRVGVRNLGNEPVVVGTSTTVAWAEVSEPEATLAPGEVRAILFRVPPLALEQGAYSFTGVITADHLLAAQQQVQIEVLVTEPVALAVRERTEGVLRAPAWGTAWVELEVRRTDGRPCTLASVSADPWPHWLLRSDMRRSGPSTMVRLLAQAPGRGPGRSVDLVLQEVEPGIERGTHTLRIGRLSGPVMVWEEDQSDPVVREMLDRDDPGWSERGLALPDLLPGDRAGASFRIKNVGDLPGLVTIGVEPQDTAKAWLSAGFGPAHDPASIKEHTVRPGEEAEVRVALRPPLPGDRWAKDAGGRIRRARTPAQELAWPGASVKVTCKGAPLELTRRVTASVLGAIQPVALESRLLPGAIDLGLALVAAAMLYVAAWALLGDYGLARLAEPVMAALGARWYSLGGGLAFFLGWLLYSLLLTASYALYRTTPGKAYAGMELRRTDGAKVGAGRAAARGVLQALFLPLICWAAALRPRGANPLDRLLGTRVVRVVSLWEEPEVDA
jgi:hypothetical protein